MVTSSILYIISLIIGYTLHQWRVRASLYYKEDPKEVLELAKAIRKAKNRIYYDLLDDMDPCNICGPNVRHVNFTVD